MQEEIEALKSLYSEQVCVVLANSTPDALPVFTISVPLRLEEKTAEAAAAVSSQSAKIQIHCTLPSEGPSSLDSLPDTLLDGTRPNLERSVSGRNVGTIVETGALPALELCVVLKEEDSRPPDFTLCSEWMTSRELTVLCEHLDRLWSQNKGMPVLTLWIDWLENHAASAIGVYLDGTYYLEDGEEGDTVTDYRAIALHSSVFDRLFAFIKHDWDTRRLRFLKSSHECPVCAEVKSGEDMCRLQLCDHYLCNDCLQTYVRSCLGEAAVHRIKCPESECDGSVPLGAIRQTLGEGEWERWDRLTLSRALDSMHDVTWCPRCQTPVLKEEGDLSLARCPYCFYVFCTKCQDVFHQGTPCKTLSDQLKELGAVEHEEDGQTKGAAKRREQQKKLELLSRACVNRISKPCPKCGMAIQKIEGCNKVTCTQCGNCMCWVCGKLILGYGHFSDGNCPTFTIDPDDEIHRLLLRQQERLPRQEYVQMQNQLVEDPNLRRQVMRCPQCGQDNLKRNRNNHLRCWQCRISFCYLCQTKLSSPINAHFAATKRCLQHSDD